MCLGSGLVSLCEVHSSYPTSAHCILAMWALDEGHWRRNKQRRCEPEVRKLAFRTEPSIMWHSSEASAASGLTMAQDAPGQVQSARRGYSAFIKAIYSHVLVRVLIIVLSGLTGGQLNGKAAELASMPTNTFCLHPSAVLFACLPASLLRFSTHHHALTSPPKKYTHLPSQYPEKKHQVKKRNKKPMALTPISAAAVWRVPPVKHLYCPPSAAWLLLSYLYRDYRRSRGGGGEGREINMTMIDSALTRLAGCSAHRWLREECGFWCKCCESGQR